MSGYFDDFDLLAKTAAALTGKAAGVYVTLNPVRKELLARAENRAVEYAKHTTTDDDILCRRWLPIDFDPKRPAGISSTETEHSAALNRAMECRELMAEEGWPRPVVADSGNGAHLLYRIELPNDVQCCELVKRCLEALALQFGDPLVDVDTTTYNASRICKVYGTIAGKGDDTAERPHRVAKILDVPEQVVVVDRVLLEGLASRLPRPAEKGRGEKTGFDLTHWIQIHNFEIAAQGEWQGGYKWIFRTCPWNSAHRNRSAYIVQRANGAIAAGCHHASCKGKDWYALRELKEPGSLNRNDQDPAARYQPTPSGLIWSKQTKNGICLVPLTNFNARIVRDIGHDDGAEIGRLFEIEATLNGQTSRLKIPAAQFSGMNWVVEHLGASAVVLAGSAAKDHTRAAVQLLSSPVPRCTVFAHTGWRALCDNQWVYLHARGAIGAHGSLNHIEVALPAELDHFVLPDPPADGALVDACRRSAALLNVAVDAVSVPLFCSIWRAPLGSADFGLHLAGPTGVFKTELAALGMQFFGADFNARHLPASWSSTGNALERLAFIAKDALLVVDDFAPTGSTADVQRYHREADRLLRAQGNNAGRQRMRCDATLMVSKPPRGLILSTGEDVPRGHSLGARQWVVEVGPNDVDKDVLTVAQAEAGRGIYAQLMAGYLRWLSSRYNDVRLRLGAQVADLRLRASRSGHHPRTPDIVAQLTVGLRYFLDFAQEIGAFTEFEAASIQRRCALSLEKTADAQAGHHRASDPVLRFLELLSAAIASGRAHVAGPSGSEPNQPGAWGWREAIIGAGNYARQEFRSQGNRVGWVDGEDLFIDLDAALAAVQEIGHSLGEAIVLTPRVLSKRMWERGLLKSKTESRETFKVRRTLESSRREVLHLSTMTLVGCPFAESDQSEDVSLAAESATSPNSDDSSSNSQPTSDPTTTTLFRKRS
jgi:Domain of unknown function (DUF927)